MRKTFIPDDPDPAEGIETKPGARAPLGRMRRHAQVVSAMLNSLLRVGDIIQTGANLWHINFPLSSSGGNGWGSARAETQAWLVGDGPPRDALGKEGDFYFDRALCSIYHKEAAFFGVPTLWVLQANVAGPGPPGVNGRDGRDGQPGQTGSPGANGAAGAAGSSGSMLVSPLTPPLGTDFSWFNQGGASYSQATQYLSLSAPVEAAHSLHCLVKTAPSTPYTVTVYLSPYIFADYNHVGICFRESATSKMETIGLSHSSNSLLGVFKWTNETTFSANRFAYAVADQIGYPPNWLRIADDGTNISYAFSIDGVNFRTVATALRGDFFTTGPNQVGLFAEAVNVTYDSGGLYLHYKEA